MTEARGRVDRQTEERTERRRRNDATIDGTRRHKLAIPPHIAERLEREGREPRWINDESNRIYNLTKLDDYDPVDGVEPVFVGVSKDGKPIKSILHSKPKDFIAEDKAKLEASRRDREVALERGTTEHATAGKGGFYADDANSIQKGRRSA